MFILKIQFSLKKKRLRQISLDFTLTNDALRRETRMKGGWNNGPGEDPTGKTEGARTCHESPSIQHVELFSAEGLAFFSFCTMKILLEKALKARPARKHRQSVAWKQSDSHTLVSSEACCLQTYTRLVVLANFCILRVFHTMEKELYYRGGVGFLG